MIAADLLVCRHIPKEVPVGKTNLNGVLTVHVPVAEYKIDRATGEVIDIHELNNKVQFKVEDTVKEVEFKEDICLLRKEINSKLLGISPKILNIKVPTYTITFYTVRSIPKLVPYPHENNLDGYNNKDHYYLSKILGKIKEIFELLDAYFENRPAESIGRVPTVEDIFKKLDEYFGG